MDALRGFLAKLSISTGMRESVRDARKLAAMVGRALLRGELRATVDGIASTWEAHAAETGTWVDAGVLAAGGGGPFDACDLRHWLALSARAGVRCVPARVILELDEDEASIASGAIRNPVGPALARRLADAAWEIAAGDGPTQPVPTRGKVDAEDVEEKLYAAMDEVPEGWMVRHVRCGGGVLKAWAGTGTAGPTAPNAPFGPGAEMGPGWVRIGNRRRVDTLDRRIVEATARGPDGAGATFVARPWIAASRWMVADDIHRAGSPIAGPGRWPCEWRCFVEGGVVVGVACYYGWAAGEPTAEDARQALECARLAGLVAARATAQGAFPRYADVELMRRRPDMQAALAHLPRDGVAFTLDFIETVDGPLMLEGGPPNTPVGGGHPCAFAGRGGKPTYGNRTVTEGVAFRLMEGVNMAEPSTWADGDRTGRILTWDGARALAASDDTTTGTMGPGR